MISFVQPLSSDYIYLLLSISYIFFFYIVWRGGTSRRTPERIFRPLNDTNFTLQINQKNKEDNSLQIFIKDLLASWVEYENFYILCCTT